jgi:hypothetical protein
MPTHVHTLVTHAGHTAAVQFDTLPRLCPCCGEACAPWSLAARSTSPDDSAVDFVFQCSLRGCRRVFVTAYQRTPSGDYTLASDDTEHWCEQLLTLHS